MTIAEICKQKDYATACYGKWHLGDHEKFLPLQQGFDDYFGLPYSNDMWPFHPGVRHLSMEKRLRKWPHLPLIDGNKTIIREVTPKHRAQLTTQYTERAVPPPFSPLRSLQGRPQAPHAKSKFLAINC